MGSISSKLCCCRKNAKKQEEKQPHIQQPVEEESHVRVVTNQGGTIDKTTDSSEPKDTSVMKKNKPVDIASITIDETSTSIPEPTQKVNKINDEKQKKKEKKKKKIVDSSSDSTSSSSSDSDSHIEKKYKRKNKDGSYTKVYSKTTFSAGTKINIVKGNNITINDNKTIIKNNPPKKTKESPQLFTQMFTEQSARYQTDLFNQARPFVKDSGGSFIDLTKHTFVEEVRSLEILTQWAKSVGILKSPRGTCTCFRVGSKYIMTALHGIRQMIKPEYEQLQNNDTDWRAHIGNLLGQDTFVDFAYLSEDGHLERNKFYFKLVDAKSVPFYDESTDSIVLELECDQNRHLPPPFKIFSLPNVNHKFSLVHHAGGLTKKVEPVDKIVDLASDRTRTDIKTLQELSETFLKDNGKDVVSFRCEHTPYGIIGNRDRLLFHCASNKGASGCPGIQVTKDGTVVVVTMLLCGYPDWYYSAECQNVAHLWSKSNTIEQGVNLASIYTAMKHNNLRLLDDVFNIRHSSPVQPVQPDSELLL